MLRKESLISTLSLLGICMSNEPVEIRLGCISRVRYRGRQAGFRILLHHPFDVVCMAVPHLRAYWPWQHYVASDFRSHFQSDILAGSDGCSA